MNNKIDVRSIVSVISDRSKSAIQLSENIHAILKNKEQQKIKDHQSSSEIMNDQMYRRIGFTGELNMPADIRDI